MTYEELKSQLAWVPSVEGITPAVHKSVIVGGMGGSALPAYAARFLDNAIPVSVHSDYDLPENASADVLYIAISYSGNTAETLSFARMALSKGFPLAAISSGGELKDLAKSKSLPFVQVPVGVQPRDATFYLLHALCALVGREELTTPLREVSFDSDTAAQEASMLAGALAGAWPLFYASRANGFLAYASKIYFNESAKMPAYANLFPELNHNEMQSFDTMAPESVAALARFVLLRDNDDDQRIIRRMDVFAELMRAQGRSVTDVPLVGATRAEMFARTWFVMHLTARSLAKKRGVDPDAVQLIEDFKRSL